MYQESPKNDEGFKFQNLKSTKTRVKIMSVMESNDESAFEQKKENVEKISNSVNQEESNIESNVESNASSPLSSQPE